MSLGVSLAGYNTAALEALSSRGLVRRADRDFRAGQASIERIDDQSAEVLAGGQTVEIGEAGR